MPHSRESLAPKGTPTLFDPVVLRGAHGERQVRNRVWMAPMCTYSAAPRGSWAGVPTDWHLQHLAARAEGGAGVVLVEATAVAPEGRISPWDLGLWNRDQTNAFHRVAATIEEGGALPAVQLAHAGRKAGSVQPWAPAVPGGSRAVADRQPELAWQSVGPTGEPFPGYPRPRALDAAELPAVVEAFVQAAVRAVDAGFGAVEIHGAHGYLLSSFVTPLVNTRHDAYAGTQEGRFRLPLEVAEAVVRAVGGSVPVLYRMTATDWVPGGFDVQGACALGVALADRGVCLLDVSSGGNVAGAVIPAGEPGYQVPLASAVRAAVHAAGHDGVLVGAVGQIRSARQADAVVRGGDADVVLLGRPLLRDPYLPLRWSEELVGPAGGQTRWPEQYAYTFGR